MPRFSIIIPTYLNYSGLCVCLESIKQYTDLPDVEIIISANGAPPETRNVLRQVGLPGSMLWFDEAVGFSRAVNAAIKESHGEFIVLLNDDTCLLEQPRNHWLDLLSQPFSDPAVGITGSHKLWDVDTQRDFIIFFCAMLRRTMLGGVGLLDESLSPFYGEDIDFCIRAERMGWRWVKVPEGEELRLVPIPNTEHLPEYKQARWVGSFPISHEGEATLSWLPEHVEVVERNRAILRERYGVNIERAKQIEGWMSESELHWLATQAKTRKVIVEIGSHCGRSTRAFADNLPEGGKVYAVDSWAGGDEVAMKFWRNLSDHITAGRVIPLRMNGTNAAQLLNGIDLCFIDAAHDYESVKADILTWQPLLSEGGLLCGHDYSSDWPGVVAAVDELLVSFVPPRTGIWVAKDEPKITVSLLGYEGFFDNKQPVNFGKIA